MPFNLEKSTFIVGFYTKNVGFAYDLPTEIYNVGKIKRCQF